MSEIYSEVTIENELKKSYLDYAMSVIIGRALPDVRDGLKPVHRRALFSMHEMNNDWNKPYKKSARIVGDVIGKYHPHGDSAVYDTIVRMAQDFSLRYPLVDGQGNFGSVDGDPPAAMRYTEIRMTRIAHEMLADLEKETVEFVPNYDDSLSEPLILPTKLPLLLINGSSGIAVGMATNIPPHNIGEIIAAIKEVIDNPEVTIIDLLKHIPGPDFPTGGIIYGKNGIYDAYTTGRGIIRLRAKFLVERDEKTDIETIVVTELPYQVNKAKLVEKIAELIKNKQIEGIKYSRDESGRQGMRIAIVLKKEHPSEIVINQLFKLTNLQTTFGIILLSVVDTKPEILNLKQILEHFILHRKDIIIKRTQYDLKKAEHRSHLLEGLKIALDNIDAVVALIKSSKAPSEAKEKLAKEFSLSEIQSQAILDMKLQRLTNLEREKILEEYQNVLKDITWFKEILASENIVLDIIKKELDEVEKLFGDKRRTEIVSETKEITIADLIVEEDMAVTITDSGYIKRTPISIYQTQRRGGKGKIGMSMKEEDFVEHMFIASTHHYMMFFTNIGKSYSCKVYDLPEGGRTGRGKAIVNVFSFAEDEKLMTVLPVPEFKDGLYVALATKNGILKKTKLMEFRRSVNRSIFAITLRPEDELISARLTDGNMDIFLGTASGQVSRFHESAIRASGKQTQGVIGMRIKKDNDRIVVMEVVSDGKALFIATENGYGKRTLVDEFTSHHRGSKGIIGIKTSERNGKVVSIFLVDEDEDIMLISNTGKIVRTSAGQITLVSRNTQGVKLIDLDENEKLVSAVRISEKE
ncbi:MAG: DNA gyrase subunit A [Desulfobacterales bacterium]|nr:DNA gyrase subunit A [Desulfobacterales bacterium]